MQDSSLNCDSIAVVDPNKLSVVLVIITDHKHYCSYYYYSIYNTVKTIDGEKL